MSRSAEQLKGLLAQAISRYERQPPTPMYQKVVVGLLVLGALAGLFAALFFR